MLNNIGFISALATFAGVWLGHVAVRRIEFHAPALWPPILSTLGLGLAAEIGSLLVQDAAVSAGLGILGITLLWDALEFVRQERRIRKGHAPANPANPRHARIMAQMSHATVYDWLNRAPRGRAYSAEELASMPEGKE